MFLLLSSAAASGTNGGELMSATEHTITESPSILSSLAKSICSISEPNTMNPK